MKFLASTVAVLAFVASSAQANLLVVSSFTRVQNASGLTDGYLGAYLQAAINPVPGYSVTNASATPWQQDYVPPGAYRNLVSFLGEFGQTQVTYTESQVDSFMGPLTNGTWSADLGGGAFSFDTTSVYRTAAQRNYLTLTSASVALWNNIAATNATGSFTFELTQSAGSLGLSGGIGLAYIPVGSNYIVATFGANSTSFTVNITEAVGQNPWLYLEVHTPKTTLNSQYNVWYETESVTAIGGAVPAPGAIALLGLAGIAGRRRR